MIFRLAITFIFICSFGFSFSQPEKYKLYNINSDDGLLSDFVDYVYQDSYGFLWVVNFEGLTRWDGHNFVRYQHSNKDSTSISKNIVYCVFEDSQKRLWIATIGGLNLYDREKDAFVDCKINEIFDEVPVNAIREDSRHRLWLGTSRGLCHYDHATGKSEWYFRDDNDKNGLSDDVIFGMDIDHDDNLWLATFNGGVNKFSTTTKKTTRFLHQEGNLATICSNKLKGIIVDHENNIWVGSFDKGITLLNKDGKVLHQYNLFSDDRNTQHSILRIYEDKKFNIWVGIDDDYLVYLDRKSNKFIPFENTPYLKYHIGCRSISSMCEDNFGNLWFGSHRNGLFYTNTFKNTFSYYHKANNSTEGLNNELAACFYEDKKENIWIGTKGGGLSLFEPKKNKFTTYNTTDGLSSNTIHDITETKDGKLWLATMNGGLINFDPVTKKSILYIKDPNDNNSLLYNSIKSILADDTLLWIGTYGEGLAAYDLKNKRFIHKNNKHTFSFDMNAPAWINHLFKDSKSRLWIGTYGGLYILKNDKLEKFIHSKNPSSLINQDINMITEDKKGRIWVVTESGGLELYDEKKKSFIHYSERYNLPMIIRSIVVDDNGKLWMGSNEGIFTFDPESKKSTHCDVSDGLQDNFFFSKSVLKSRDGKLYFGGNNGFNVFQPDSIKRSNAISNFYFTNLYIFDQLQKPGERESPLKEVMLFTDKIELSHIQSFFSIGFADINLYAPGKTQYAYKLEGLYDKWIFIQSERKVSFTNLDPGTYTLRVKYTIRDGEWKEANKRLIISILPPWWKTWWFKTLAALMILGAFALVFYIRVKAIRTQNKLLESEVKKRTQELTESNTNLVEKNEEIKIQNETLEEYNEEITRQSDKIIIQQEEILLQNQELEKTVKELDKLNENKDRFFYILAHDLKNPVNALSSLSKLMKNKLDELDKKSISEFTGHMEKSALAVSQLLNNLLDWARTQSQNIQYSPSEISLSKVINRIVTLSEQQCRDKNIQVLININDNHQIFADENMAETILRNIISNSIKFTPKEGTITIESKEDDQRIIIEIRDTGIGMSSEEINDLFQIDKISKAKGTEGETGTGLGLIICKEFLQINSGTMTINSQPGKESTFTIRLPKSSNHEKSIEQESDKKNKEDLFIQQKKISDHLNEEKISRLKGKRIMIVEDNQELRAHLRILLSGTFEVVEAENGKDGIQQAINNQPHLIITDMIMPVMDGLEFCKEIKSNRQTCHIPVILLTAQVKKENQIQGYEAGADQYLTKPVEQDILYSVILNLIQSQENVRQRILQSTEIYPTDLSINSLDEEFLTKVIQLIEENISDPNLDYTIFCKELSLSRTVLYAKFKTITGQGVNDFIKSIRLKKSIQLLMQGKLTVSQIGYEVGFNSPSYYIRCFTKEYEMPPKEYAAKHKR